MHFKFKLTLVNISISRCNRGNQFKCTVNLAGHFKISLNSLPTNKMSIESYVLDSHLFLQLSLNSHISRYPQNSHLSRQPSVQTAISLDSLLFGQAISLDNCHFGQSSLYRTLSMDSSLWTTSLWTHISLQNIVFRQISLWTNSLWTNISLQNLVFGQL